MPFGRRSPLEALALPGAILAYKYSQFRQRRREAASRRVTERELSALHHKIDKLLNKLEESEPEPPTSQEDECVICINARATMQTSPCGHRVVCRRCFVKTIQSAVAQRLLPLRCVICRARITRLSSSSGTWRLQESASSYSMGTKSWAGTLGSSPSSYSVGVGTSVGGSHVGVGGAGAAGGGGGGGARDLHGPAGSGRGGGGRVAQSASLYSMSSGSSFVSGNSNVSHCSNSSAASTSAATDASQLSSTTGGTIRSATSEPATHRLHHHQQQQQQQQPPHSHTHGANGGCCSDGCNGAYPRTPNAANAGHHQNPQHHQPQQQPHHQQQPYYHSNYGHHRRSKSCRGGMEMHSRLPPIKEFRSPTKVAMPSPTNNSKIRFASYTHPTKATSHDHPALMLADDSDDDLAVAETSLSICVAAASSTRSLGIVPNGPASLSSPRTILPSSATTLTIPVAASTSASAIIQHNTHPRASVDRLSGSSSPAYLNASALGAPRSRNRSSIVSQSAVSLQVPLSHRSAAGHSPKMATTSFIAARQSPMAMGCSDGGVRGSSARSLGSGARIAPMASHRSPINMAAGSASNSNSSYHSRTSTHHLDSISANRSTVMVSGCNGIRKSVTSASASSKTAGISTSSAAAVSTSGRSSSHRGLMLLSKSSADERADNRKNESVERKKRDDKQKQKAEKEARKEEKRLAKEEERLAKMMAKEEKKKGKREAKELLLVDAGRKK